MSSKKKKKGSEPSVPMERLERNTLTLSLVVVILGLICLPNIERGGDTWYVLMLVFGINAVLLIWIISRIIGRIRDEKKDR